MAKTPEQQAILDKMDASADEAAKELLPIIKKYPEAFKELSAWARKNAQSAGYKRLGRILVEM